MSDPSTSADEPTQEELQAYFEQLRDADPGEVVAQAYTMLGTGAEVKIGRADARVLIDAMAAMTEAVADTIETELATRMRNGVVQLQNAQVQAERQAAGDQADLGGEPTSQPQPRPAASPPGPAPSGPADQGATEQGKEQSASDRLWIPGREPR